MKIIFLMKWKVKSYFLIYIKGDPWLILGNPIPSHPKPSQAFHYKVIVRWKRNNIQFSSLPPSNSAFDPNSWRSPCKQARKGGLDLGSSS